MSAILKVLDVIIAIPAILRLLKDFWGSLKEWQRDQLVKEGRESIKESTKTKDQRPMEEHLGSENAGKPTQNPHDGIEYTDVIK